MKDSSSSSEPLLSSDRAVQPEEDRPDWVPTCPCGATVLNQGDLCTRCEKASATDGPRFTENEIKDVLTALYQDGHVDLVLADRIAALMGKPS